MPLASNAATVPASRPVADNERRWGKIVWPATVLVASLAFFFRDALTNHLTLLYGDSYDGLIEIAILEHWYGVVAHQVAIGGMGWFYPHGDTLGYNDTYLLPAIAYVPARLAGLDPMLAAFASHVAMKAVGWAGMYFLLRQGCHVRQALALAGASLFATANASLLHMYHAQLLAVGMVPWLMSATIATGRAAIADDRSKMRRSGAAFALLFGATALSAFYQAWFFGFFSLVFVAVGYAAAGSNACAPLVSAVRRHWQVVLQIAVMTGLALIPLLVVYLPVFALGRGHDWNLSVVHYLPTFGSFVNVGYGNLVWGDLLPAGLRGGEDRFGFAPGLLVMFAAAAFWSFRNRKIAALTAAASGTVLALGMLVLLWPSNFSLWHIVYDIVPGASAVRVVSRFQLFALVPMIAVVMVFLERAHVSGFIAVAILAFLLVEEIQTRAPLILDRGVQQRMLADVGPPPAMCRAFFVVSARRPSEPVALEAQRIMASWGGGDPSVLLRRYRHNVDAMLISAYYRVPTINGYSTFNPTDWNFEDPLALDYAARVRIYATRHRLQGLCALDRREAKAWRLFR